MKDFIDFSNIPKDSRGKNSWKNGLNCLIPFCYKGIEGELLVVGYDFSTRKVEIQYKNNVYSVFSSDLLKNRLGTIVGVIVKGFKFKVGDNIKNDKRDLTIIECFYKEAKDGHKVKYYKYHCNICGNEDYISEHQLIKDKTNCSVCMGNKVLTGYNDIATLRPDLVKYFVDKELTKVYRVTSSKKILAKCPICGYSKLISIRNLANQGFDCNQCGDGVSYPNKFLCNFCKELKRNNLIQEYIMEKVFDWSYGKQYDAYITLNNGQTLIIEAHGEQHYSGGFERKHGRTLQEEQRNDAEKCWLAYKNGVNNYIQLDCRESEGEYIKNNILNNELLSSLFNLEAIQWDTIFLNSIKSNIVLACELWNNGLKNTKLISEQLNVARGTAIEYLKKGAKLNLCNYVTAYQLKKI